VIKSFITSVIIIPTLSAALLDEQKSAVQPAKPVEKANPHEIPKLAPDVIKLRRQIREYLAKNAKRPIPKSLQEITGPVNASPMTNEYIEAKDDPQKVYYLYGRDLALVDRLLIHKDVEVRRSGLDLVHWLLLTVHVHLKDRPLAVNICDAYIAPNFALADISGRFSAEAGLLQIGYSVYGAAQEYEKQEAVLKVGLNQPATNENTIDAKRFLLAQNLVKQKKYNQALEVLDQVEGQNINMKNGCREYAKKVAAERDAYEKEKAAKVPEKK
jgi:hypothetical protein